ncbi:permease [Actinoplanes sp. TFC3]|uniref:permease n=1 Tax=Actinoplanes sp. TFC3 TaxID=1710355 RepID=UPI000831247E|nr:permease [Actinoplanes sp. TFC3]
MSVDRASSSLPDPKTARAALVAGLLLAGVLFVVVLLWAKWLPYATRTSSLAASGAWSGSSILSVGGVQPGDAPSWQAATSFAGAYLTAVWKALTAALLISAAVQSLVPRRWLLRVLNRRGRVTSAVVGGLCSTPSMMCTCCTAPVAVTLRRSGVSTAAALAYWLGNPLLNPAVLIFLVLVAPWQWTVTRLVVGVLIVVGGSALVARLVEGRQPASRMEASQLTGEVADAASAEPVGREWLAGAPARFGKALLRLSIVLIPEYLIMVLLIGAFRGWLFPIGTTLGSGVVVVMLAAIAGTLLVIPTAGEIPILQGLALAGVALGPLGALLVTLPAVSLPGIAMVGRALGWRTTALTTAMVIAGGVLGAGLLTVL